MPEPERVLIVDTDQTFVLATAERLRREGYECDFAPDLATACKMLLAGGFHLLIADPGRPGRAPFELINEMQRLAEGLPVILVTTVPSLESALLAFRLKIEAYLVKPLDAEDLVRIVREALERYRLLRAVLGIRERVAGWGRDLENLKESLVRSRREASAAPLDAFLDLTVGGIVGALLDLRRLCEAQARGRGEMMTLCHLLNCPGLEKYQAALEETIEVLEKTKGSFKSKRLGKLRCELKDLLEGKSWEESPQDSRVLNRNKK